MENCKAITKSGNQCKNKAVENSYCRTHIKKTQVEQQIPDISAVLEGCQTDNVKEAPDVFGKLFGIFIGLPTGIFLVFSSQDESLMLVVYFIIGLIVPYVFGRGLDHMIFINNRQLGETISDFIPFAFALAFAIGAAVIAFNIVGGFMGIIAAIVAAVVMFIWFLS